MNTNDTLQHFGVKGMKWGVKQSTRNKIKKAAKIAGGVALGTATVYGAYKLHKHFNTKNQTLKKIASKTIRKNSNIPKLPSSKVNRSLNDKISKIVPKKKVDNDALVKHVKLQNRLKVMNNRPSSLNDKLSMIAKNNSMLNNKAVSQGKKIDDAMNDVNRLFKDLMK